MPHEPAELAVEARGLQKSFKGVRVLEGIDLAVTRGTIYALLGANGAGKTTTIKILTTLLAPDAGSAQVAGFDVARQPQRVRECISLTGQFAAVDEMLSGRENMQMIGRLRHLDDVRRKADELLERFDLAEAAARPTSTYSGGMRRRLDLAMSLLGAPEVVFLDEPTTGLDPLARADMWRIIKELRTTGVTVFLTTQYLEEADHLADHLAILHQGVIAAEGSPAQLKKLIPQGHIVLRFNTLGDLRRAVTELESYAAQSNEEEVALQVSTDGTVEHLMAIFTRLQDAGVEVAEFTQSAATLDDVFLSVIEGGVA